MYSQIKGGRGLAPDEARPATAALKVANPTYA